MVLNFYRLGRHLVIDVVLCTVYRNVTLAQTCSIPGYAAKMAEDRKIYNDKKSSHPVSSKYGGDRVFVPFAMEDGGTLGAHALALLKQLAEFADVSRGSFCSPDSRAPLTAPMQVSLWDGCSAGSTVCPLGSMSASLSSCCACTTLTGLSLQCLARCIA